MIIKRTVMALAAASLLTAAGSVAASAQENCGFMYQRVTQAYQMQSPHYAEMLNHYNERCLSGSSSQPTWGDDNRHQRYEYDRHEGYDSDRARRGW